MTITPEEIMAYVDGDLDEPERSRVTLAALTDMDLADRIARERQLRDRLQERLRAHFAPVAQAPVPEAWTAMIAAATSPAPISNAGNNVVDFAPRARPVQARWWRVPLWGGALAASLVIGLVIGMQRDGSAPFVARNGALVASGDLARALDGQLASSQQDAPIRMLASFRRADGDVCRVFAGPSASGIACHVQGNWAMQHVLPGAATGTATGAYRQAASGQGALMGLAQAMAVGEPLDANQERAVQNQGWR